MLHQRNATASAKGLDMWSAVIGSDLKQQDFLRNGLPCLITGNLASGRSTSAGC